MKNLRWSLIVLFVCWSSTALFSQVAATLPDRIHVIMSI